MNAILQELIHAGIYKRTQGRITRQVTFAVVAIGGGVGLHQLFWSLTNSPSAVRFGVPGALLLLGLWVAYRIVNVPDFADFLIAVEAEINKVSWPTRGELFRASLVVLFTIFALATLLTLFDLFWSWLFGVIGVL